MKVRLGKDRDCCSGIAFVLARSRELTYPVDHIVGNMLSCNMAYHKGSKRDPGVCYCHLVCCLPAYLLKIVIRYTSPFGVLQVVPGKRLHAMNKHAEI